MKRLVWAVWLCFVVRAGFYAWVQPLWEGYDEYSHFAYVQYLVHTGKLPVPGVTKNTIEVESSLVSLPVPWSLHGLRQGSLSYEEYRRLPAEEQARRAGAVVHSPEQSTSPEYLYEAQQPPLYYWLMAPLLTAAEHAQYSLLDRVRLLRYASVLLASLAFPIGFLMVRRVSGSSTIAIGALALAALMPEFLINIARVGNEAVCVVIYTVLTYACVRAFEDPRSWRSAVMVGVALGTGLLSKIFFLTAIPVVVFVYLWARDRQAIGRMLAALGIAAVLAGWWYRFVHAATGDITGQIQSVGLLHVSWGERVRVALHLAWWRALDVGLLSHIWFGGWSFLQLRAWIYHLFYALFAAAIAGLLVLAWRRRIQPLLPLLALEVCFCASLAYHAVLGQIGYGVPMTSGWYLYALVFSESLLLIAGLGALITERRRRWVPRRPGRPVWSAGSLWPDPGPNALLCGHYRTCSQWSCTGATVQRIGGTQFPPGPGMVGVSTCQHDSYRVGVAFF